MIFSAWWEALRTNRVRRRDPFLATLYDDEVRLRFVRYASSGDYGGYVPRYCFHIVRKGQEHIEVGRCDLRIGYNEELDFSGHIGYNVNSEHRGHGYAKKASRLLLRLAFHLGMDEVLITCNPDNVPSRRTCESLGGRFAGIFPVPEWAAVYRDGDREKCRFYYDSADFRAPALDQPKEDE